MAEMFIRKHQIHRYMVKWIHGYMDTWIHKYVDIRILVKKEKRLQVQWKKE